MSWTISTDAKVAALSSDTCRLLFTWMIAHGDNLGRMPGEPGQIKALVAPRLSLTEAVVARYLNEMAALALIVWYEHDGMRYVAFPKRSWDKHQRLHRNMSKDSDFPDHTEGIRKASVSLPCVVPSEVEGEGEVEGEVKHLRSEAARPSPNGIIGFTEFWNVHPKKRSKGQALKAWKALHADEPLRSAIMAGLGRAIVSEDWLREDGRFIPYPATWLRARGWEDEIAVRDPRKEAGW